MTMSFCINIELTGVVIQKIPYDFSIKIVPQGFYILEAATQAVKNCR